VPVGEDLQGQHFDGSATPVDVDWILRRDFDSTWKKEVVHLSGNGNTQRGGSGGYCRKTLACVGHRFARAIVVSTLAGQTLYSDAFRLLDIKSAEDFDNLVRKVGIVR